MIFYILFFLLQFLGSYASLEPNFESDNYYEILGVSQNASRDVIKKQYNKLSLRYHPDKNPGNDEVQEKFKKITIAWGILSDQTKRAKYDAWQIYKSPILGLRGILRLFIFNSPSFYNLVKSKLFSKPISLWTKLYIQSIRFRKRKPDNNFYLKQLIKY